MPYFSSRFHPFLFPTPHDFFTGHLDPHESGGGGKACHSDPKAVIQLEEGSYKQLLCFERLARLVCVVTLNNNVNLLLVGGVLTIMARYELSFSTLLRQQTASVRWGDFLPISALFLQRVEIPTSFLYSRIHNTHVTVNVALLKGVDFSAKCRVSERRAC